MPFLAPTFYNDDPVFALMIAPGFYLLHIEVADEDSAGGGYN